ncbi:hypothetical protein DPMN_184553 [Dreissena polymorpha]|uniref:Uncharacterized protein n=1 Tax=Dreissena polymorpha TaxID=45954 RepID=A0A9D4DL46_DREPO|nr:hypothetical protein DPMN_184553 [Dreissena polymorpha]
MYLDDITGPHRLGVGSGYTMSLTKVRQVFFLPATPELLDDVRYLLSHSVYRVMVRWCP